MKYLIAGYVLIFVLIGVVQHYYIILPKGEIQFKIAMDKQFGIADTKEYAEFITSDDNKRYVLVRLKENETLNCKKGEKK